MKREEVEVEEEKKKKMEKKNESYGTDYRIIEVSIQTKKIRKEIQHYSLYFIVINIIILI